MNHWEHPLYHKIKLEHFQAYLDSDEDYSSKVIKVDGEEIKAKWLCPIDSMFKFMNLDDTHTMMDPSVVLCDGSDWPFHYPGPKWAQKMAAHYDSLNYAGQLEFDKTKAKVYLKTITG